MQLSKAVWQERAVIVPALIFWFFCIKAKEQEKRNSNYILLLI
jgi:hypothetical protein